MSSPAQQLNGDRNFTPRPPKLTIARRDRFDTSLVGVLPINKVRMGTAVEMVMRHLRQDKSSRRSLCLFGVNAQIATLASENSRFASAMLSGDILYPDGISTVLAAKLLGRPLLERTAGGDLMDLLCHEMAKDEHSIFLFGGLPGAGEKAAEVLQERHPGLRIAGVYCPPLGFEKNPEELARARKEIQDAAPDMLLVGLGVPKQEVFIWENLDHLPVGVAFPIGAALDTTAGLRKRAPRWAQNTGTEWLYRLVMEPRRLWRRYLIGNTKFILMVLRQWTREKLGRPFTHPAADDHQAADVRVSDGPMS